MAVYGLSRLFGFDIIVQIRVKARVVNGYLANDYVVVILADVRIHGLVYGGTGAHGMAFALSMSVELIFENLLVNG